jgi:hypothetical protein
MLENIAEQLAQGHIPDELLASVQLEGIAYVPPGTLSDIFDFAVGAEVVPSCDSRSSQRCPNPTTLDRFGTVRTGRQLLQRSR